MCIYGGVYFYVVIYCELLCDLVVGIVVNCSWLLFGLIIIILCLFYGMFVGVCNIGVLVVMNVVCMVFMFVMWKYIVLFGL